ncbi:MAG: RIO1 family regulatory kinase/ATPase, partial [Candidatus Thiodiazotropha sp. 6PDIVS]
SVIIDLPQVVDASANNNAARFLKRDVSKITEYYGLYAPELLNTRYGGEIWALYEAGELHPEVELSGQFKESTQAADVNTVLQEIEAAFVEEQQRQERLREA